MLILDKLKIFKSKNSVNIEAYKAMYEYFQKQLEHEKARLKNFEDKAAKFMTMISIIITAYIFMMGIFLNENIDLCKLSKTLQLFTIIIIILLVSLFYTLGKTWFYLLNTLKLKPTRHMPSDQETIDLFINNSNSLHDVYHYLCDKIKEVVETYKLANETKINLLSQANRYISISAYIFAIIVPLSAIYKYIT